MVNQELPEQRQNPVKDPDNWTTGDEPMTGPQARSGCTAASEIFWTSSGSIQSPATMRSRTPSCPIPMASLRAPWTD